MSTPTRQILYSFHAGEIAPSAYGRGDIDRYNSALKLCKNFIVTQQGGIVRRMGTHHVGEVKDSTNLARLIRFVFSNIQAYQIEFGNLYARFYMNGGIIESSPGVPVEISSEYTSGQLRGIAFAQSADVLYMAHSSHRPKKLSRTSHTSWTLSDISFEDGPYLDMNKDTTLTLTLSSVAIGTGVTMTASSALFNSLHVGSIWRIEESSASKNNQWEAGVSYSSGARVINDGRVYQKTVASTQTSGKRAPTHEVGTENDGTIDWTWLHNGFGIVKVTGYTDATHVTVEVLKTCPNSATGGTIRWREGAWSNYRGWPSYVTFFQERLVFANTSSRPQTTWMSCSSDYERFSPTDRGTTVLDSNAITFTVNGFNIAWLSSGANLVAGTGSGVWVASAASTTKAIAPDNVKVENQTAFGSEENIQVIRVGSAMLFVQRGARRLRELLYFYEADSFKADELSVLSDHLTQLGGGIVDCAFAQEPYSIWVGTRSDGVLLSCTYVREQKLIGWSQQVLGGSFSGGNAVVEDVSVIPATDGDHDQIWLIVKRTINGQTRRYIEYIEKPFSPSGPQDSAGMWYLDSALSYSGPSTATISGLDHLEGETVSVLADGAAHPERVVSGGEITLDGEYTEVVVGLKFTSLATTLPLEAQSRKGSGFSCISKIHDSVMQVQDSLGFKYGGGSTATIDYPFRMDGEAMDSRPNLASGFFSFSPPMEFSRNASMTIEQSLPYPLNILSMTFEATIYE